MAKTGNITSTFQSEDIAYNTSSTGEFRVSEKGSLPNETEKMKVEYHKQRLWQSKMAFVLSFAGSIFGFVVIVGSVIWGMWVGNSQWPGIVSGIVVEAVSALFYTLSNKANEKISKFFKELTIDSNIKSALGMADKIENDSATKNQLYVKLSLHLSGISEERICKNTFELCNKSNENNN